MMKSGSFFNQDWTEQVTLPVKRVGTQWEFLYGGDVPVKDGTLGELTLCANQIVDQRFRERVTAELIVKVLDEGTPLLVALSDRSRNGARVGTWPTEDVYELTVGTTRLERIFLGPQKERPSRELLSDALERGGLWLKLKGLERTELIGSTVLMPEGFKEKSAISLNHAFTLLSQEYETHRISNTGNVYTRIFYQERNGRWYPLKDLRTGVHVRAERKVMADAWAEVERILGWRPLPSTNPKKPR